MKPQRKRQKFIHAAPPRLSRGVVTSAAFLAIAATGGVLLSQFPGQAQSNASTVARADITGSDITRNVARADVARDNGKASRGQARTPAAPTSAPAAPVQALAAPAKAPAAPVQAPAAPVKAPAAPAKAPVAAAPSPPAEKVLTYQFQLQPNYYYCGPATTRIVLSASGHLFSQDEVARGLHTTTGGTNSADDATRFMNSVIAGKPYQTRSIPNMSAAVAMADQVRADVVQAISGGRGVVANIVHSATDLNGGQHTYDGGHYVAIVGYKDGGRAVKIADPANTNGDGSYWVATTAMAKWMATHGYSY